MRVADVRRKHRREPRMVFFTEHIGKILNFPLPGNIA